MSTAEALATALQRGLAAMRSGDPAAAAPYFRQVCTDPEMIAADDLADVRARAASVLAAALLAIDAVDEASFWCDEALRLARATDDASGVAELRDLASDIAAARHGRDTRQQLLAEGRALAARPLEELLAATRSPLERADVLQARANAELIAERPSEARRRAEEAIDIAQQAGGDDALRIITSARITIARAYPAEAHDALQRAWQDAADAGEHNLITAIARAAHDLGATIGVLTGPEVPAGNALPGAGGVDADPELPVS